MKKTLLAFILAIVSLISCKKPQEMKPQSSIQQSQFQNNLILAAEDWYKVIQTSYKSKNASLGRSVNLQDLPWMPQWGKAKIYPISEDETLIFVPVWRYANIGYSSNLGFTRRLKIVVNHAKQTMTGVIAEMIMEKSTLEKYQDDMFYYAHMQMLQGNKGKYLYTELSVDHPVYLLSSIDPNNVRTSCGNSDDPHTPPKELTIILSVPTELAGVCMQWVTDGCETWMRLDNCDIQGGGGELPNAPSNPPMTVTIPSIPPLNFPGMMPPLIPINNPISLPSFPYPTPWLPWLSYPIGGVGIDYPIDPGSNVLTPDNPLSPEDQRVLDQLDRITERYGLLVALPNNGGFTEMYKIDGQDRLNLARTLDKIIKSHPAYRNMYDLFISKNIKITWQLNPRGVSTGDAKASIKETGMGRTNFIIFKSANTLKKADVFAEELIHLLQIDKLGSPFEVPSHQRVCIEFEAKATVAMLSVNGSAIHMYGLFDSQNIYRTTNPDRWDAVEQFKDDFNKFLRARFEKNTSLPKNKNEMDWQTFMSLLSKYRELAPPSYSFTGTYDANSWQWATMFELFNY